MAITIGVTSTPKSKRSMSLRTHPVTPTDSTAIMTVWPASRCRRPSSCEAFLPANPALGTRSRSRSRHTANDNAQFCPGTNEPIVSSRAAPHARAAVYRRLSRDGCRDVHRGVWAELVRHRRDAVADLHAAVRRRRGARADLRVARSGGQR